MDFLKLAKEKIEHPPKPVVYYSMNNLRGRLGSTRKTKRGRGCDAASSIFSERFDARLHGAGINDEENAGRYKKRMSGMDWEFSVAATSWSGEGYGLLVVSAPDNTAPHYPRNHGNPYIEKGMHTRSQHYFLGAGSYRHKNAELHWSWGASEVRHPASFSL
jgi:hypothetical protein